MKSGKAMRDNFLFGGAILAIMLATGGIVMVASRKGEDDYYEATPKTLLAEPRFYEGRHVKISTAGMEITPEHELIYRSRSDQSPTIICRFKANTPLHIETPSSVTGVCLGRKDGVVYIVECVVTK